MFATRNDCPDCATRLPRWARFCSGCGRHLLSDAGGVYGDARTGRWWRSRRGRVRAAALALGVTLLASPWLIPAVAPLGQVVAGYEVSDTGREVAAGTTADASADTGADADAVIGDVEVPRAGAARPSRASLMPPPCLTEGGSPCGEPILAGVELLDAVDVVFGAVVVDTSLNVHRLQMIRDRAHVRWRSELEPSVRGSAAPGAVRVERSGTTLLVGTANELHALGTKDGHHEWTASLAGRGDGRTPWHGWVVEDTVFAVNPRVAAVLDADDGQVLWQEDGPFTGVLPLATGVAVLRDGGVAVFGPGQREPRWERDVDPLARFPRGADRPNHGPIPVAGGGSRILLDPASGALIHDLGHAAEVTRAHGGSVVSVSWDAEGTASALVGFAADGRERWRLEGPDRPCCHVEVCPTDHGRVIALFPGGADGEAGWLIEPATGTVAARVHRPADVAWVPRLLSDATVVWLAVLLYVPYTYLMYVVAPYNDALLLYIAAIGLGIYGLLNGLFRLRGEVIAEAFATVPRRGVAWFLLVVAALFTTLWLVDILSVWPGGVPDSLFIDDLPSIVHVLDLAVVLPLVALTGVLLLRGHPMAPVLAAIVLVKTLTLGLALLSMNAFIVASGGEIDPSEPVFWSVMVLVTAGFLTPGARRMRPVSDGWLRPSLW